jgi:hypothetical protein
MALGITRMMMKRPQMMGVEREADKGKTFSDVSS